VKGLFFPEPEAHANSIQNAAVLGRAFLLAEAQSGKGKEIIFTWGAWQRLSHGGSAVPGKILRAGGEPETIVGVLSKSFAFQ
jgi:hypothetical protein